MKGKHLLVLAVAFAVLAGLVTPTAAQDQKIVTIIYTQEPDNLNPMYSNMWFAIITKELYLVGAWDYDQDLNPHPVLVTEIPSIENGGISEDGTVITLHLRDDITWSDGEPITADDFVFTYEMITSDANTPISRYPYEEDIIAGVEAPDERTVVVTFVEPFAPWLATLFTYVLPEHVLRPVFEEEGTLDNAAWNRAPTVGSGPFVFKEWETGGHIYFERNENYFGPAPILDGVFIRIVPDDASQIAALLSGDADMGTFIAYSDVPQLEETGYINIVLVPSGYNEAWFFNLDPETAHPAMLDVNVRRALVMAFDRWRITEDLLLGRTYPPASYWENTPYASPNVEPIPYDPEEAARLLDEAGWVDTNGDGTRDKDGVELVLRYLTPPRQVRMDTQVIVQQEFAELGIGLTLENPSYDIFWNSYAAGGPIATGQFDIAQWSQNPAFPDPDTNYFLCSEIPSEENPEGANWSHYCNEEVDALLREQARTVDYDARVELFHQIDELLSQDIVWVGVWHDPDLWAYNTRVQNLALNGATPFWNCYEWDIAE